MAAWKHSHNEDMVLGLSHAWEEEIADERIEVVSYSRLVEGSSANYVAYLTHSNRALPESFRAFEIPISYLNVNPISHDEVCDMNYIVSSIADCQKPKLNV